MGIKNEEKCYRCNLRMKWTRKLMEIIMYDIIMKNRLHARVDFSNALSERN